MHSTPLGKSTLEQLGGAVIAFGLRIAELATLGIMALIVADVVMRNLFNRSLLVVDELTGYLLVIMTFFGAAYSLRSGAMLRIEFILVSLPARIRALFDVLFDVLALGVTVVVFWQVARFTWSTLDRGMVAPTLLETPLWLPQVMMPLGCLVLITGILLDLAGSVGRLLWPDSVLTQNVGKSNLEKVQ